MRSYVFEGPDDVGKTTLIKKISHELKKRKIKIKILSFPGNKTKSIGKIVYDIHHNPYKYDLDKVFPSSLQTLHLAAHMEIFESEIKNVSNNVEVLLFDRFWLSLIAYSKLLYLDPRLILLFEKIELFIWKNFIPTKIFVIERNINTIKFESEFQKSNFIKLSKIYSQLQKKYSRKYNFVKVDNSQNINLTINSILKLINEPNTHNE